MTELTNQLRQLGKATEAAVEPVTADEAVAQTIGNVIDLDADSPTPAAHLKPRRSGRILVAAAAALIVAALASVLLTSRDSGQAELGTAAQPGETQTVTFDDNGWEALRQCESSGAYRVDTGNNFFGAYQFTKATWVSTVQGAGLASYAGENPSHTPPEVQDAAAASLYLAEGADAWPVCGRHLSGPMITPVVPQWLPELPRDSQLLIYIERTATPAQIQETTGRVMEILGPEADISVVWFDKLQALAEMRQQFVGEPEILANVRPEDLPSSLRLSGPDIIRYSPGDFDDLPNVMTVLEAEAPPLVVEGVGQRLIIDAIDVDVPMFSTPSIANLQRGVAAHRPPVVTAYSESPLSSFRGPIERTHVVTGYRAGNGAPFARLDELEVGDIVEIHTLLDNVNHLVKVERFAIDAPLPSLGDGGPTVPLVMLPEWDAVPGGGLHIVTTGDAPGERFVLFAKPSPADTTQFGVDSDN